MGAGGAVVGTLVHGLFESEEVRAALLDHLARGRGLARPTLAPIPSRDAEYDRLAASLLEHLDWELLCRIAGLRLPRPALEGR